MPAFIDRYFSQADLDRLEQAVADAERGSAGEIALVLTRRSSGWWRDGWLVAGLAGIVIALACMAYTRDAEWGASYDFTFATVAGALAFALALALWRLPWARTGTSKSVWKKALRRFHRLRPTRASTGVLLYISLEERQVAVVADRAIAEKVPAGYWDLPRDTIVAGFRSGKQTEAIIEAVQEIGSRLAQHFPRPADDTNELPDRPVVEP